MTKRRDIVNELKRNGFWSEGGKRHEQFTDGVHVTQVPRHNEIRNQLYKQIRKQAGFD